MNRTDSWEAAERVVLSPLWRLPFHPPSHVCPYFLDSLTTGTRSGYIPMLHPSETLRNVLKRKKPLGQRLFGV